jgi:uncharacterized caspase-like protein
MKSFRLGAMLLVLAALLCCGAGCKQNHTKSIGDDQPPSQPSPVAATGGARVALLIGCGAYRADPALVLDTPANDMKDLGAKLRGLGFEVIQSPDATVEEFYGALARFGERAKGAAIALFFYSGHGIEYENQNYLIPVTATLESPVQLRTQTVNLTEALKTLDATGAAAKMAVLDCCRNNPFRTTKGWLKTKGVREEVLRELGEAEIPQSTMVCFATGAGQKAAAVLESETERNSPFTALLLKELDVPGESIFTIFLNVYDRLKKATNGRQAPALKTDNALSEVFRETVLCAGLPATPNSPADSTALAARIAELEKRLAAKEMERPAPTPISATPAPTVEMVKLATPKPANAPPAAPPASRPADSVTAHATKEAPFVNSLGMKFVPVPGTTVLFSVWDTRVKDYAEYGRYESITPIEPRFEQGATHPVVNVDWDRAQAFCAWLSKKERRTYRLPTDAEWSMAVGPQKYPWGNAWPPPKGAGNYSSVLGVDRFEYTSPVGSFAANQYGLYDMGGNVLQWCEDQYRTSMYDAEMLKEYSFLKDEKESERDGTPLRVLRGSSWSHGSDFLLRSTRRGGVPHTLDSNDFGFRCVLVISGG